MAKKEKSDNAKLTLTVNMDQAYTLMNAMEMYARLHIGQFDHIDTEFAWNGQNCNGEDRHFWENSSVRASLRKHLTEAREIIFPELRVIGPNGSHGIYSHKISPSAHNAWDIYQVVRHTLAVHREPNPIGFSTSYNEPMQVSEKNPLPTAIIKNEKPDNKPKVKRNKVKV